MISRGTVKHDYGTSGFCPIGQYQISTGTDLQDSNSQLVVFECHISLLRCQGLNSASVPSFSTKKGPVRDLSAWPNRSGSDLEASSTPGCIPTFAPGRVEIMRNCGRCV